ncbi:MAG: hypothetical protein JWQ98_80 [Chlorobi bacterium]|nr:hypothetical protein [Chlorobiota bacterium]
MTFLNPFLLVAMAAAAVPLLLHLLNLRKLRTVEFSSLRFLKELQKTRIRKLKLKQILLLILRTALVIFAVLAFARPALRGSAGLPGARAATTAVILIDNSFSMDVRDERGSRFRQAQQAALDLVDLLQENDDAYLIPMTDLKGANDAEPTRSRDGLRNAISSMKLGYRRADLDDGLRVAASLLDKSENLNKELYIITDAQRSNASGAVDSLHIFGDATRIYLLPIGNGSALGSANLGLDSIRVLSSVFEINKPVEMRAWVHNYGESDVQNVPVSIYLNGERAGQSSVTVAAGKTEAVELSGPPKHPGLLSGRVEIEGDALDADNRRYFAFPVGDRITIAVAGSPESLNYLGLALPLAGGAINVERTSPGGLGAVDLSRVSAVVLADAAGADAARLGDFVANGGGMVIYGGPGMDRNAFNGGLGAALGIGLGAGAGNAADKSKSFSFASVDREHPIFNGVFDPANPGNLVESPAIYQMMPAAGGETIIRLSNGQPFMSEFRHGKGRVIYIAAPPTGAWSDLPLKGIFVPIATRSALYVGSHRDAFPRTTVGENVTVNLPSLATIPDQVKVIAPSGRDQFVPVRRLPGGVSITYDRTDEPGTYKVMSGNDSIALFTADMGSGESDLTQMTGDRLRSIIAARMTAPKNLTVLQSSGGDFGKSIVESRFGLELWKYMLVLALLCAFAEMVVGRATQDTVAA